MLLFCPKCQIHLRCAVQDKVHVDKAMVDVVIEDFTVAMARMMGLLPAEEKAAQKG
jgi:hypothetical protein